MKAGKSPEDYKKENIDNREKCDECDGTGYVPKRKVKLSPDYPAHIPHPDQELHPGERILVQSAEEHKARHPKHFAGDPVLPVESPELEAE